MLPAAETLLEEMKIRLLDQASEKDIVIRSRNIITEVMTYLDRLKHLIKAEGFAGTEEEITFFKYVKPRFHAAYIYHATLLSIEGDKPIGSAKARRRYYHSELRRIDNFFYHHLELYKYYRSGRTDLDQEYFLRQKNLTGKAIDIVDPFIDRDFCTLHSIKIALLLAYEQVKEFLQKAMRELKFPQSMPAQDSEAELAWTDSKVGLIELIYAFHAAGVFNNGKAGIKQITSYVERVFQVNLGNTSRSFQEILARKKGYTNFLNRLIDRLLQRINNDDL